MKNLIQKYDGNVDFDRQAQFDELQKIMEEKQ